MARLQRFGDRFELYRDFSLNASRDFEDGSLDFVYLDAMHEYKFVKDDLWAWWPKACRISSLVFACRQSSLFYFRASTSFGANCCPDR